MLECRYHGWCRIEYDNDEYGSDFGVWCPCIGDGVDACMMYEPMPDVDALLELTGIDREALLEIIEDLNICLEHAGPDIEREYVQLVRDRLLKACGGVISGEPDQH